MSSTIGSGGTAVGLATLSELQRLTTEGTLVNLALLGTREWQTEVLELDDGTGSLSAHVVDGVLVTEPVGPFYLYKNASEKSVYEVWMYKTYSIVHIPSPIIFSHVLKVFFIEYLRSTGCNRSTHPQSGVNTSLQKLLAHVLTIRNRRYT